MEATLGFFFFPSGWIQVLFFFFFLYLMVILKRINCVVLSNWTHREIFYLALVCCYHKLIVLSLSWLVSKCRPWQEMGKEVHCSVLAEVNCSHTFIICLWNIALIFNDNKHGHCYCSACWGWLISLCVLNDLKLKKKSFHQVTVVPPLDIFSNLFAMMVNHEIHPDRCYFASSVC